MSVPKPDYQRILESIRAVITKSRGSDRADDAQLDVCLGNLARSDLPTEVLSRVEAVLKEDNDVRAKFSEASLNLLEGLRSTLAKEEEARKINFPGKENHSLLSLQDQAYIRILIELLICWGMSPNFQQNVGIPASLRTKKLQQEYRLEVPRRGDETKLAAFVRPLVDILLDPKSAELQYILATKFLTDLVAALVQLAHSPDSAPVPSEVSFSARDTPATLVQPITSQLSEFNQTRKQFRELLNSVVNRVPLDLVVDSFTQILALRNSPAWLKKQCGTELSACLMLEQKHGVQVVIDRIIGGKELAPEMLEHIVGLITTVPRQVKSKEAYYEKIHRQVLGMLHAANPASASPDSGQNMSSLGSSPALSKLVASRIIGRVFKKEGPEIGDRYFLQVVLKPLHTFKYSTDTAPSAFDPNADDGGLAADVVIQESEIQRCVEDAYNIVRGNPPIQPLFDALSDYIPAFFRLFCFTSKSKSFLSQNTREILAFYMKFSTTANHTLLRSLVMPQESDAASCLVFGAGSSGGVVIRKISDEKRNFLWEAECVVQLLKEINDELLAGNLFVELLHEFARIKNRKEHSERFLILLQILAILSEQMGPSLLKNIVQVCTLLKSLLAMESDKDPTGIEPPDQDTLALALGVLSTLLNGSVKVKKEEEILLFDLLPELEAIAESTTNEEIHQLASETRMKIMTRDPSWIAPEETPSANESAKFDIKEILKDLNDPLIPVRAHGLVTLRRMVLNRDAVAQKNLTKILNIFQTQIQHDDSFVYLIAVRGLAALADVHPDRIIPIITEYYANNLAAQKPGENSIAGTLNEVTRTKVGEALVQIAKRCGQTLPQYASYFVNALLRGARDPLPSIRASAMSNLAELCKYLHFALHPYIRDILSCIYHAFDFEQDVEVRRAAVFACGYLLRGLGQDVFQVIPDDMTRILGYLRRITGDEREDDVTRFQAKLALEEINVTVRSMMDVDSPARGSIFEIVK
eukprot:TRINITY_DN8403_c0_g1_i1.p1 TRINITY_DN8403_c0_g1~~TRINITY_DN8403_c0_g1_i1.p1  ORF type:complete len:982 (-),score=260.75 TRINITY_DN8403_c0_g1_i1:105-3050(-)